MAHTPHALAVVLRVGANDRVEWRKGCLTIVLLANAGVTSSYEGVSVLSYGKH